MRAIRNGMDGAGIPVAGEQGRVGPGPAGAQLRLCRGARDGRPPRHLQERREGDRLAAGPGGQLHGEVDEGPGRQQLPHPQLAVACGGRYAGLRRPLGGRRHDAAVPPLSGGPARRAARAHLLPRALRQLLQALPGGLVRAHECRLEPRQPHGGFPGHRPGALDADRVPRPRRRRQPVPRLRRPFRRRPSRHREQARAGARLLRRRLQIGRRAVGAAHAARRRGAAGRLEDLRAAFGDDVVDHYVHAGALGAGAVRPRVTDWELVRYFERA